MDSGQYFQVEDNTNPIIETLYDPVLEQLLLEADAMSDAMSDSSTIISDSEEDQPEDQPVDQPVEEELDNIENKCETYDCSICYKTLNMDNNVVTKCQHHFCDKCFYRWIQTNASCPICRTPIDTNAHLTQEQLATALSTEYSVYVETLEKSNIMTEQMFRLQKKFDKLNKKYDKLNNHTNMLLNRQISLRALNDQTEASNDGIICAREKYLEHIDPNYMNTSRYKSSHTPGLYGAFYSAYEQEKERLELMNNPDRINKLPLKKRKNQSYIDKNIVFKKKKSFETERERRTQEPVQFSFQFSFPEEQQSWTFEAPGSTESKSDY